MVLSLAKHNHRDDRMKKSPKSDKYVNVCWFAPEVGRSAAEHILGTLLVVDGYTGKGKNKHECTRIKGSERNSEDST